MLFSAHVVDTSPLAALRRKPPQPGESAGLLSARTAICAPFTPGALPRPQLSREAMVACWQDESALDAFLVGHPTGQAFADGWHVRLDLVRAVGVWPGLDIDMVEAAGTKAKDMSGPSVAITIGTAYLKTVVPFMRVNSGLEDQFLDSSTGIWGTAMSNLSQRLVATLTIWDDVDAASDYMRSGAHGDAVKNHFDPAKDPTGHTFVTGGGFFGFKPLSTHGAVGGKNAPPTDLLASLS